MDCVVLTNMVWGTLGTTWHEGRIVCVTEMLRGILMSQSFRNFGRWQAHQNIGIGQRYN